MAYVDDKTKQYFLSLKPEELGIKKQTQLFARSVDPKTKKILPPKYNNTDRVKLRANEYINKNDVDTTLGRLVFNKICIEPFIKDIIPGGYWNKPLNKDNVEALIDIVAKGIQYKKIDTKIACAWEKAIEFYSLKASVIYNPSYNSKILIPDKEFIAKRDEFVKNNPNATTADYVKFEDEITSNAKKKLDDNPGIGLYKSGAKGKIDDQYKNISIMIGPVYNPATGEMEPVTTNFIEGFDKKDLPKAGNMLISAAYPKACGTADAGYITKQYYAAFQSTIVDDEGTDCKTKSYIKVFLTDDNWPKYEFQNIFDGDKTVCLTQDVKSKYVGKWVKLRSPMCCLSKNVCAACAGRLPYISGIKNIGVTFAAIPNAFLNAGMKKFHTTKVKMDNPDPDKLIF